MNTLPTILIDIENLLPLPKNAKKHTAEQVENIKNSIKSFGFNDPLGIWQNKKLKKEGKYYVVTGNGTLDACKELEITQIPCNDLSNLSEEEMRAYAIAHNATTLKTGFDYGILEMELSELDFNFSDFGLDIDMNLSNEKPTIAVEDDNLGPEILQNLVQLNKGDVFEIGKHRLIYGDSTNSKDVAKLMNGKLAGMIFTDPPFNLSADKITSSCNKLGYADFIMGSGEFTDKEFTEFLTKITNNLYEFSADNSLHFICMDYRNILPMMIATKQYDKFKNLIVWVKHAAAFGGLYRMQHELIFIFQKGKGQHIQHFSFKDYRTNVWNYEGQSYIRFEEQQGIERVHPTMKPIQMIVDALQDCSNENDIVLDLFGGSGSTMVAAHKSNRIAYLSELDVKYCNVIIRRMLKIDNSLRVICNNEDVTDKFLKY